MTAKSGKPRKKPGPANGGGPAHRWWGRFEVPLDHARRWSVGDFDLWLAHHHDEWVVACRSGRDIHAKAVEQALTKGGLPAELPSGTETVRIMAHDAGESLEVTPALADRNVVIRPESTIALLGGQSVRLFVGTTVWVQLRNSTGALVLDQATVRPSDTWLGPNTTEGELSYAGRTTGRTSIDDVQPSPARAITAVTLVNSAEDRLDFDRLSLPLPNLALYVDARGRFWTDSAVVERGREGELARVRLERGAPAEATDAEKVAEPRQAAPRNVLMRTLHGLLG